MRIDMSRMAATAIEAALDEGKPRRRRFSGLRAVVTGAALVGLARVAIKQAPSLPRVPDFAELGGRIRDRLADGWPAEDRFDDDEPVDEGDEDFEDEEEQPAAEADDEDEEDEPPDDEGDGDEPPDDEGDDDEPVAEADEEDEDEPPDEDEDEEDEPVAEADEEDEDESVDADDDSGREAPGVDLSGNGHAVVDPAALPPEPPSGKNSRTKAGRR